ncbi:MAG: nicotinamide riboside transporter PnuC [Saprospiraceae bacterium]
MDFFSIENIVYTFGTYELSYIELIGTIFGLLAVYWASRENIWTWPASLINVAAFFILFYQINLYADMFLQVYFFIVSVYGWYNWLSFVPSSRWSNNRVEAQLPISRMTQREISIYAVLLVIGTIGIGYMMSQIHLWFPHAFSEPAAFPYPDAFTTTASILAMILLSQKKIENWLLWIIVDIVAVYLYYLKDILFVSIEYVIFLIICIFGYINWRKELGLELQKDEYHEI